ncbi:exosortase/archaeosortase family protein [Hwangdonia seohaensis]|uniref:Exosortase/archaeosortase family protein n=1 Tax=Hwangdonia seohaensis TaxID=1240727 RepID=A0ABW3RBW9_9FLAO|nr:exosortase/archaeosortase family protein [Hwangdonia seohaensis]
MKHRFKLSKFNIIYASIVAVIIIFLNSRIYGFDAYTFGMSLGSIIGIILFPILIALLFWFILGREYNGGTTTFNIVLTLMFLGSISEFAQIAQSRQKPIDNLQKAVSEYKERTLTNPDSTDSNYSELSTNIKSSIDDLLKTSVGEERKVWLALKDFFKKSDSTNIEWNKAYNAFADPRILDLNRLDNSKEFEFQKRTVQEYVNQSNHFKSFVQNRVSYLIEQTNRIDKSNKAYKGFIKGLTDKDSIQKPIFTPYINAHIEYGQGVKKIIELLENELGKWSYENETETLIFENSEAQTTYEKILNDALSNEEIVNELFDKLVEIM